MVSAINRVRAAAAIDAAEQRCGAFARNWPIAGK